MSNDPRIYTKKILELLSEGCLNKDTLIRDLLNYLSESEVFKYYEQYKFDEFFESEDEEDEED